MSRGEVGARIPTAVQNNMGDGKLEKGNWNGMYLIAWDLAEQCTGEACALYDRCVYKRYWQMDKKRRGQPGVSSKCMMQQRYLKNVAHAVVDTFARKQEMNREQVLRLGFHIIPLYAQLFKFKCWEYGHDELVYVSEKGTPKVHPVYKEIREIIKTIESVWMKIGGNKKNAKLAGDIGDSEFVDAMYEEVKDGSDGEAEQPVSNEGTGFDFDEEVEEEQQQPKKKKRRRRRRK